MVSVVRMEVVLLVVVLVGVMLELMDMGMVMVIV